MKNLMLGNEAVARGAWEAGVRVATAYPGTPSTEITESLSKYEDVYCEWSPNEKVALEAAIGSSIAGARTLCSMKHVGVNVAADPLFTAAYTGVNAGLVLMVADDPGMHSSQNEQDSRYYARSAHVPMLEPADSAECLAYTKKAFEISEAYDTPVMVRLVTRIAHSRSLTETGERQDVPLRDYDKNPKKYVMMPGFARPRHVAVEQRENKLRQELSTLGINRVEYESTDVGVICSGSAYNYVKEALPQASVLKLGMVYPLDDALIREFASKVKTLYVVEELEPFIEDHVKTLGIPVSGKDKTGLQGELFATTIAHKFAGGPAPGPMETPDIPGRPPVLCPGCPHRPVYYMLKKLGLNVAADIGCYTLGAMPPLSSVDTVICMGASISMAGGMEKARGPEFSKNTVAVIGDSTFAHSGITGLVNLVYNQTNATVLVLDNSTTGMTGQQNNPMNGKNIRGELAPAIHLEKLCEAIGVPHVRLVDPFDLPGLEAAIQEETGNEGTSVIIVRHPCVLLSKAKSPAYSVDQDLCIHCGMCMKVGCPAIIRDKDKVVSIDATLCNGCGLCADVCPKQAIQNSEGEE